MELSEAPCLPSSLLGVISVETMPLFTDMEGDYDDPYAHGRSVVVVSSETLGRTFQRTRRGHQGAGLDGNHKHDHFRLHDGRDQSRELVQPR
jgi:hypothetical protein